MRIIPNRKDLITVKGKKIGNIYIRSSHFCYPINNPKYTQYFKDDTEYFWFLEKIIFNYKVLNVCRVSM